MAEGRRTPGMHAVGLGMVVALPLAAAPPSSATVRAGDPPAASSSPSTPATPAPAASGPGPSGTPAASGSAGPGPSQTAMPSSGPVTAGDPSAGPWPDPTPRATGSSVPTGTTTPEPSGWASATSAGGSGSASVPNAVDPIPAVETITTLTVTPAHGWVGTAYTFRAEVAPAPDGGSGTPAGGSISWVEDGVVVGSTELAADGTAAFTWTADDAGIHAWSATFSGSDGFAPSKSSLLQVDVSPPTATEIRLTTSAPRDPAGVAVTVTARLDPLPPNATVAWSQDGASLGSIPVGADGTASIQVTLPSGTTTVTATYDGMEGFLGSSGSISIIGVPPPDHLCADPLDWAEVRGVSSADVRAGRLTFLGATAAVSPATFDPRTSPVPDPGWTMWYRAMYWLVPLAVDAYLHGDPADVALVEGYVAQHALDPDPGSATAAALTLANGSGWDEGTNLRREMVLNCLARITPSPTVSSLLDSTITANLDGNRYYGLPRHRPHNHGVMANLTLMDSGDVLSRPDLIDAAQARLLRDATSVAEPCGMVYEQSAAYHALNARLWPQVSRALRAHGRAEAAAQVEAVSSRLSGALRLLFRPDGQLEIVGDGAPATSLEQYPVGTPNRMVCAATGWAAARTSWLPSASFYTFRFGPGRSAHGHADHGSITWTREGRPVLEDVGGTTELSAAARAFVSSNAAHNVLGVAGLALQSPTSLIRWGSNRYRDLYVVRDTAYGITRTRSVRVDPGMPLLVVLDRATSTTTRTYQQRWHFDTRWRWDAACGRLTDGKVVAGVVTLDLLTGRMVPASRSATSVMVPSGTGTQQVLTMTTRAKRASLFSVAYVSPTGVKPVLRWYPSSTPGWGRVRIWWGRIYRDIQIDPTGIRS